MTLKQNIYDILLKVFVGLSSFTIFYYMSGGSYPVLIDKWTHEGTIAAFIGYIVGIFLCNHFKNYFTEEISEEEL